MQVSVVQIRPWAPFSPENQWLRRRRCDVANFFRFLQRHYVPFVDMMRFQLTTRAEFNRLTGTDPSTLTDLERAARFLYLQRTAFGGKPSGRNFGVALERSGRFDLATLVPMLDALHERLSGVVIECLPYAEFIQRYDRKTTLFYLDPPYWGGESDYGKGLFERANFQRLADQFRTLSGSFVLSINDVPQIREIFAGFKLQAVKTTYSVARKKSLGKQAGELIITN